MKRRVVVTGLGWVTPLGCELETVWQSLLAGESGIRLHPEFQAAELRSQIAGLVQDFVAEPHLNSKEARIFDPFIQYGVVAAAKAMASSGLVVESDKHANRCGVAMGSGIGGLTTIENNHTALNEHGARKISPYFIPATIINLLPGLVSMKHNLRGPNVSVVTACTTGAHNIAMAARTIMVGDADVMIAGGAEKASTVLGVGGFAAARALSTRNDDPAAASRPWDKDRDGFVLGDGAGALVLESYEHAVARGANILAEVTGVGMSADAYHMTQPSGEGAARAMQNALSDAGFSPDAIGYVNAHGTSTPLGDGAEVKAIREVFGEHADQLAVSSTKSMLGHSLGATGAVEAIVSVLALRDQMAPPTINCDEPSEDCDLNFVPNKAQAITANAALSNSFGFGGTNASLIFSRG